MVVVVVILVGRLWLRVRYEANLSMKFDQATAGVAAASATGTPDDKILGASGKKPTGTSLQKPNGAFVPCLHIFWRAPLVRV